MSIDDNHSSRIRQGPRRQRAINLHQPPKVFRERRLIHGGPQQSRIIDQILHHRDTRIFLLPRQLDGA